MDQLLKKLKEQFGEDLELIEPDEKFKFTCVACGECCKNRTGKDSIILSPYDIFNLMKNLDINFQTLLNKHLSFSIGHTSGIPVMYLDSKVSLMSGETICTFLKKQNDSYKCSVHAFKPTVCAIYPLGRFVSLNAKNEERELKYMNVGGCSNHFKSDTHENTIDEWINNRETTEKIFIEYSEAVGELYKIIKLNNLFDSEKISPGIKASVEGSLITFLYAHYDTDKDFMQQFHSNMDKLSDLMKLTVSLYNKHDKSIISKFKDFYSEDKIKNILLEQLGDI